MINTLNKRLIHNHMNHLNEQSSLKVMEWSIIVCSYRIKAANRILMYKLLNSFLQRYIGETIVFSWSVLLSYKVNYIKLVKSRETVGDQKVAFLLRKSIHENEQDSVWVWFTRMVRVTVHLLSSPARCSSRLILRSLSFTKSPLHSQVTWKYK